ncbi:MAG: peptide deformylase [Bacteroidales bacterium]|nr:peptide deformylase [Bacteroidales bacterium]
MAVKKILPLGNPMLYEKSEEISTYELKHVKLIVADLHDTLIDFRKQYNCGRAIAAPQIGIMKRLIYMYIDKPIVFINPILEIYNSEMFEVWDDCMSFPSLLVRVKRYKNCRLRFKDINWKDRELTFSDDLSELIQHEYDHLEGILATQRAVDQFSFVLKDHVKV